MATYQSRAVALTAAAALALTAAGCAAPARTTALVAPLTAQTMVTEANPLFENVGVGQVTGGRRTGVLTGSQISNEAFAGALDGSMALTLLKAPGDAPAPTYEIDATVISIDQPILQVNVTVTATVKYALRRVSDGRVLFAQEVTTPHRASLADTIVRSERFRLASEGAAKANIAEFLNRLVAYAERAPYALL